MRILFLSTSFPRWHGDGMVNFVFELAQSLAERMQVTVLTPNFPGGRVREDFGELEVRRFNYFFPLWSQRVLYPDGIPVQLKRSRSARFQAPFFLLAFIFKTVVLSRNVDLVLCNWALTGLVARAAGLISRKPYIVIVRGTDMKIMKKSGLTARLFLTALHNADAVCAVARHLTESLADSGVAGAHLTPNGIDLSRFAGDREQARKELSLKTGKLVLFVGSLIEVKGVRYLIEAMRDVDAELAVVGDGCLREELERQAQELGVKVSFVGRISPERVARWYAACDVFVLPSLSEGRPNVLIEAMASGRACVASDIPGCRELIRDGSNGLLFVPGNTPALQEKIKKILGDEKLRSQMEVGAIECVRRLIPSWAECAENYKRMIGDVLSNE